MCSMKRTRVTGVLTHSSLWGKSRAMLCEDVFEIELHIYYKFISVHICLFIYFILNIILCKILLYDS